MRTSDSNIERLARIVYQGRELKKEASLVGPPVLLLGAGCSISSGCPSTNEIIAIGGNKDNNTAFEDLMKDFGPEFLMTFQKRFEEAVPSTGYWFLAELIKNGYFDLILTTNFDSCLEKVLSKLLSFDEYRILVRNDVEDDRIVELLNYSPPGIKLLKLHGYFYSRNMIIQSEKLWNIGNSLNAYLAKEVKNRGIIIVGYSMHESRIIEIFKDQNQNQVKKWYVCNGVPDNWTRGTLRQSGFQVENQLTGELGEFDSFFSELAFSLGRLEFGQDKSEALKNEFINKFNDIERFSRIDIDMDSLRNHTEKLLRKLSKDNAVKRPERDSVKKNWAKNLVFIDDPDMPGGMNVLKIIQVQFKHMISGMNIYKIPVKGRKENDVGNGKTERIADEPVLIDGITSETQPDYENLLNQNYILVDSISFSGNTMDICGKKLYECFGKRIQIGIAVIFSSPGLENMIDDKRFSFNIERFYRNQVLYTHQILFPWGLTLSTKDILPAHGSIGQDQYIPHKRFAFMHRPWGNMLSMIENENVSVKILNLKPREMTSLHRHHYRDEIFFILDDHMIFQIWDDYILLRKGSTFRVPAGTKHRLIGLDIPCRVLEIAENYYNQVEDIDRFEDKYNPDRCKNKGNV